MSEFRGTKKDWHAIEFAGIIILKDSEFYEGKNILDYDDVGKEVADANAKLAMCAPKMLEALKRIMNLKPIIEYPEMTKQEHVGEAQAISSLISDIDQLIKEATS